MSILYILQCTVNVFEMKSRCVCLTNIVKKIGDVWFTSVYVLVAPVPPPEISHAEKQQKEEISEGN